MAGASARARASANVKKAKTAQSDDEKDLARDWGVSEDEVVCALNEALEHSPHTPREKKHAAYLYAKKLKANEENRFDVFQTIIHAKALKSDAKCMRASMALDIVLGGSSLSSPNPPYEISINSWMMFHSEWRKSAKSYVIDPLIQRVQSDHGLCYLHAAIVAQHYLVSRATERERRYTIDIPKFVRSSLPTQMLESHIFSNGGCPMQVLHAILQPKSITSSTDFARCEEWLPLYGPGVITQWQIEPAFFEHKDNDVFLGQHSGSPIANHYHSMLVIGSRRTATGELRLLLQNWWRDLQFLEVDETYWDASRAHVVFVKTPQEAIPSQFATTRDFYAETSVDLPTQEERTFD